MFFDESHVTPGSLLEGVNRNIQAIDLLESVEKIVTLEYDPLLKRNSVNVYRSSDGSKKTAYVNKGVSLYPIVTAASPDLVVLMTREDGRMYLRVVDLSRTVCIGTPVAIPTFDESYTGVASKLFSKIARSLFSSEDMILVPCSLAVFASHGRVVVHDGQAREMAHRLLSIDVAEGKVCGKPVMTWDMDNKAADVPSGAEGFVGGVENRAEVPLVVRGSFVTGARFGWVRRWCAKSLLLLDHWQLRIPATLAPDKQWPNCQIYSLASSANESRIAVGTCAGSIHILDTHKWCEDGPSMIPHGHENGEDGQPVKSLSFCANDQLIVAVYSDGAIRVWDEKKRTQVGGAYANGPLLQNKEKVFVAEEFKVCWYTAYGGKFEILDIRDIVNGSA